MTKDSRGGIASLWGQGAVDATRARECVAMPGKRKQEILTPSAILDPLRAFWGRIACDPCGTPLHSIADLTIYQHENGLGYRWPDLTFINPPYANLKDWLAHYREHATGRACLLGPVRSHRKWWRAAARESATVFYLKPITFVGYPQAFPAPLCLLFNRDTPEAVADAFPSDLGGVI
jgi:hypothetical protein